MHYLLFILQFLIRETGSHLSDDDNMISYVQEQKNEHEPITTHSDYYIIQRPEKELTIADESMNGPLLLHYYANDLSITLSISLSPPLFLSVQMG